MKNNDCLIPDWPAPSHVRALVTTRQCGNFSLSEDQQQLKKALGLKTNPIWLEQVHGNQVVDLNNPMSVRGDAAYTQNLNQICVIRTADCLPILITDIRGQEVAAIHAGWKGLAAGVIDATVSVLKSSPGKLIVWFGPAIGQDHFEVGSEVREQFLNRSQEYSPAFQPLSNGKWLADIYQLAQINLQKLGVDQIYGGGRCTYCEENQFFSYRRDHKVPVKWPIWRVSFG